MTLYGEALPQFPWDTLERAKTAASQHPGGLIDLSIGTPVDPTPVIARDALREAADAPSYPPAIGIPEVREAIVSWWQRRRGASHLSPDSVLPTIGSKEMVALLPAMLGLGSGDVIVHPATAYPTYDVGARLAGATPYPSDAGPEAWPAGTKLVWLNSPGNPHGHVLSREELAATVAAARERGIVIASDECYAELPMAEPYLSDGVPSVLSDDVCGSDASGLLALYSLSKQSNLAGYRAAFIAGDTDLIARLREIRKHAGFLLPTPVQRAMVAVLADDEHVARQRAAYQARREVLAAALTNAGLEIDPRCVAGLYLWARRPGTEASEAASLALVDDFAARGILIAPGSFYGTAGFGWVRIALSASDSKIRDAAERLSETKAT